MNSELDQSIKGVSSAALKYSNDKILKASSLLKDAMSFWKEGEKRTQEDFSKIFSALESLKADKSAMAFGQQIDAISAILPAFALRLLPAEVNAKEHVLACKESAQFYSMRVLKIAKESNDDVNIEWANAFNKLIDNLSLLAVNGENSANNVSAPVEDRKKSENSTVPVEESPQALSTSAKDVAPAQIEVEGNRIYLRNAKGATEPIVVKPESFGQALVLEDCNGALLKVEGKITAVVLDKCRRIQIEVEDVVTNIEVLGSGNCKLFLRGNSTTVVLDDSEAIQIYLLGASRDSSILTSKCNEINLITAPIDATQGGEEDLIEVAIPAQFKSFISADGTLVTKPVQHAGN